MSHQQREALAANWDPEILAAYMAKVQREDDDDEDEAMSSGDSDGSDVEFEGDTSMSSESTALSDMELAHPDDIASNDSAFSSEDEFAEESITEKQTMRREVRGSDEDSDPGLTWSCLLLASSRASDARNFAHAPDGVGSDAYCVHEAARRRR
jgi:hypothetical protein